MQANRAIFVQILCSLYKKIFQVDFTWIFGHISTHSVQYSNMTWWGDQAIALTAATWSEYVWNGVVRSPLFHTISLLSFPPDAKSWPSGDHLRPQISCLCPISFFSPWPLISRYKMALVNRSDRNTYYLKNDTITWPRTQLITIPSQGTNSHLVTFYCSNSFWSYWVPNLNWKLIQSVFRIIMRE